MIYLDNAATTPVTSQIAVAVMEALVSYYGNPESPHSVGRSANEEIFKARKQICKLFGQDAPSQIIFTSGGTEANNLAILGLKKYLQETGKTHIITSKTEHKSVLLAIERLEEEGFDVTYISPGKAGRVTAQMVKDAIREDTGLVSIMYINNETGCINDVAGIQKAIKEAGDILFHCDCVQAVGYYDLKSMNEHHVEGYVKIRDLLDYCENQKDHSICPNDFMRMNHSYFSDKYPKWISVEDRLPELPDRDYAFTTVIATVIGKSNTPCTVPLEYERILVKGKRIERWKFIYGRICRDTITHWQELPAPVKKDVRTDEA